MFPQQPAHSSPSAEMLRRILVESGVKQHDSADRTTEHMVLGGQQVENVDGPIDDVSTGGRLSIGGYSWDNVIADTMLSMAAAPAARPGAFRHQDSMLAASSALGTDSDSEVVHELALLPHDLEEDVNDEPDQGEMLGLSIDHDSSGLSFRLPDDSRTKRVESRCGLVDFLKCSTEKLE